MTEQSSAAAFIKRFREAKPTSREERESVVNKRNLWWEEDVQDDSEYPRRRPVPSMQSAKPASDLLHSFRQQHSSVTSDIDDIFKKNIHDEFAKQSDLRHSSRFSFDLDSSNDRFNFEKRPRSPSPTFRFGRQSTGTFGALAGSRNFSSTPLRSREFGNNYNISPFQSKEFERSSVETLGSTGFKGLLTSDLKLDGRYTKDEEVESAEKKNDGIENIHTNLALLMESMAEAQLYSNKEKTYFPDGVAHTIPQVAVKLAADMLEFKSHFPEHLEEDKLAEEQKKRDDLMMEKGRQEQREKQLLQVENFDFPYYRNDFHSVVADPTDMHMWYKQQQLQNDAVILNEQHKQMIHERERNNRNSSNNRNGRNGDKESLSALQVSTDNNKSDDFAPASSPFATLDSDTYSTKTREAFNVGNDRVQTAVIADSIMPNTPAPFDAQEELSAQQMRELLVRVTERGGALLQLQRDILDARPPMDEGISKIDTASSGRQRSHNRTAVPVNQFQHPVYGPLISHSHNINPYAPPTYLPPTHGGRNIRGGREPLPSRQGVGDDQVYDESTWQAAPELEHKNVATAAKSIISALKAMEVTLNTRLPPDISTMSLADRIRATMAKDAEAAAAGTTAPAIVSSATAASSSNSSVVPVKSKFIFKRPTSTSSSVENEGTNSAIEQSSTTQSVTEKVIAGEMAANLVSKLLPSEPKATSSETESAEVKPDVLSKSGIVPTTVASTGVVTDSETVKPAAVAEKVVNKNIFGLKPNSFGKSAFAAAPTAGGGAAMTNIQQLADMDAILGVDNYRRVWGHGDLTAVSKKPVSTLGLGHFIAPPPETGREIMRSGGETSKPDITAVSAVSQSLPLPWESTSSSSVDLRTLHGLQAPVDRRVISVQASTDEMLRQRQHHALSSNMHPFEQSPVQPSAPPVLFEHAYTPKLSMQSVDGYRQRSPQSVAFHSNSSSFNHSPPVVRPVEGFAMQQLHVTAAAERLEYQQQSAFNELQTQQKEKQYTSSNAGLHNMSTTAPTIAVPVHEREAHLLRMRQLRLAMMPPSGGVY